MEDGIGYVFYFIIGNLLGLTWPGIAIGVFFALIGFLIGTFKIPSLGGLDFTKKTGGENIDDIIKRAIKFKMNKKKIYVYKDSENEEETE